MPASSMLSIGVGAREQLQRYEDLGFRVSGEVPDGAGVLVLPRAWIPVQELIARLTLPGRAERGILDRNFEDPDLYQPLSDDVPRDEAYWVQGFDPGLEYLNIAPREAVPTILGRGRLPATIEEGLAAFVQNPGILRRNACFSLPGSTRGDKRVPALWISKRAPKLGWCFAGAPHTWLGCASVSSRAGVDS